VIMFHDRVERLVRRCVRISGWKVHKYKRVRSIHHGRKFESRYLYIRGDGNRATVRISDHRGRGIDYSIIEGHRWRVEMKRLMRRMGFFLG